MPLIQGGPPEWIWERTPNLLKPEVVQSTKSDGQPLFELRVNCGLEIMRLQFFTRDELRALRDVLDDFLHVPPQEVRGKTEGVTSG